MRWPALISAEASARYYEAKGLALGEMREAPETARCARCRHTWPENDVAEYDGQPVCVPCCVVLDPDYGQPDRVADL